MSEGGDIQQDKTGFLVGCGMAPHFILIMQISRNELPWIPHGSES